VGKGAELAHTVNPGEVEIDNEEGEGYHRVEKKGGPFGGGGVEVDEDEKGKEEAVETVFAERRRIFFHEEKFCLIYDQTFFKKKNK
jgi:hypothetical protein